MAVVHPDIRHNVIPEGGAALCHFIFMMREQEVDAAAMNVEGLAKMFPAHRRTFDVPAGTATPPRALPAGLGGDRRLPQDKIHRPALIRRDLDPRTRDHFV